MDRQRKHWGWGFADEQPTRSDLTAMAGGVRDMLGLGDGVVEEPVALDDAAMPDTGLEPPAALREIWDVTPHARASHAWGKSYSDVVRGFRGDFRHAPDAVLRPRDERDVEAALEWAAANDVVVIPFGGGTSVVGGVTPMVDGPCVSLDLARLDRVLEVDDVAWSARIQAGAFGPALEAQLGGQGFTL